MSQSEYYDKVTDFENKIDGLIASLTEAKKTMSPSAKDPETWPGLMHSTPHAKQLELLNNVWIALKPLDGELGLESDVDELICALNGIGNPVEVISDHENLHKVGA